VGDLLAKFFTARRTSRARILQYPAQDVARNCLVDVRYDKVRETFVSGDELGKATELIPMISK
jgi:hypothetical protein